MNATAAAFPTHAHSITVSRAILWGGLIAGALDATDGVVAYGFQGLNPIQVLQYIASGVFRPSSFKGGLATAGLGTLSSPDALAPRASLTTFPAGRRWQPDNDSSTKKGIYP